MFLAQPLSPLTGLDAVILAAICVVLVDSVANHRRRMKALDEGRPGALLAMYRDTIVFLWGAIFVIVAVWVAAGRPFPEFGLAAPMTPGFAVGAAAGLACCMGLVFQVSVLRSNADARAQLAKQVARSGPVVTKVLPRTQVERFVFMVVAASAGIGEEMIFRGFLLWTLAHWTPEWLAALLSAALFTVAHLYQQRLSALTGVAAAGAVYTVLTLVSGSLLPAMLLHFAVDWSAGESVWAARKEIGLAPKGAR